MSEENQFQMPAFNPAIPPPPPPPNAEIPPQANGNAQLPQEFVPAQNGFVPASTLPFQQQGFPQQQPQQQHYQQHQNQYAANGGGGGNGNRGPSLQSQYWPLVSCKYVQVLYLCYGCNQRLYQKQDKITQEGNSLLLKIPLCGGCVQKNMVASQNLMTPRNANNKKNN